MKNDILTIQLNTMCALRKLKTITVHQKTNTFNIRPQLNVFLCQPFGTGKSRGVFKPLQKIIKEDCVMVDDFSKAGFLGSINKRGEYVPGTISRIGGKVLIIDEWNSVDPLGRHSLLSVLENNKFERNIGFRTKEPFQHKDEYIDISIFDGVIKGTAFFSVLAGAMFFPRNEKSVYANIKEEGLLSRFTPLFRDFTMEGVLSMLDGELYTKVLDYAPTKLREVIIDKKVIKEMRKEFDPLALESEKRLFPRQYGYVARIWADIVRIGVANHLSHNTVKTQSLTIEEPKHLVEIVKPMFLFQSEMYIHKDTKSTLEKLQEEYIKDPNRTQEEYSGLLGVSQAQVSRLLKKIGASQLITSEEFVEDRK